MQLARRNHRSAETMNELRALNARFIHNFVTNDVPSHDAILHPAFINIWPTGQRWDRAAYLKYWATAFDPKIIVYWDVRDELITIVGDVALVRATNKHTRRRDGQEVTGMTMYTDTGQPCQRRSRTSMDQLIVVVRNIPSTVQIWRARARPARTRRAKRA